MDSLRYWVQEMHVDGFRFDLAPALARRITTSTLSGTFLSTIGQDPVLSRVKLIAEPWDVGPGGYQVGQFPPRGRVERPVPRHGARLLAAAPGSKPGSGVRDLAYRLSGSSDLFDDDGRGRSRRSTSSPRTTASPCATW